MALESKNEEFEADLKALGDALRKLRKDRGYTNYHKLAYDMEMTHSQYGSYESGRNITLLTLLKILKYHNLTLREFIIDYLE